MKKLLSIVSFIMFLGTAQAQDMHFSQFFATPLFTNPAFTGHFEGTYRFSGMIRRQWQSVSDQPFQTHGGGVDMNAPFNWKKLGIGLNLAQDFTGLSNLTTNQVDIPIAFRTNLGNSERLKIHIGVSAGFMSRSVDYSKLTFDEQFENGQFNGSIANSELVPGTINKINYKAGVYVEQRTSERQRIGLGYSIFNLSRPDLGFFKSAEHRLERRHNVHLLSSIQLGSTWDWMPSGQIMFQGPYEEYLFGMNFRYHLEYSEYSKQSVQAGIFGRAGDAGYLAIGATLDDLFVGASYDFNLSTFQPATNYRGGWEVTVIYIIQTVREKTKRLRMCPDYL